MPHIGKPGKNVASSLPSAKTVKNKIHALDFSRAPKPCVHKKRQAKYLYIDADEDHVAL